MPNFFYYDTSGQKQGLVNDQQLQALAAQGVINPQTPLETEGGHKGTAGQIPGLFPTTPSPFAQPAQAAPPSHSPSGLFCTNCGNPIGTHAVACMSCGANPVGHRRHCRYCGVALNPQQVICVKCGAAINSPDVSQFTGTTRSVSRGSGMGTVSHKSKKVAGLLGIFLGGAGAHKFYMGSWGWGIVYLAVALLSGLILWLIPGVLGIIEGIQFLTMSEDTFAEKYPKETEAPFRW